jgi:hypothetical protein
MGVRIAAPAPPVISDESFNRLVVLAFVGALWLGRRQRRSDRNGISAVDGAVSAE